MPRDRFKATKDRLRGLEAGRGEVRGSPEPAVVEALEAAARRRAGRPRTRKRQTVEEWLALGNRVTECRKAELDTSFPGAAPSAKPREK